MMTFNYFLNYRAEKSLVVLRVTNSIFRMREAKINDTLRPEPEQPTNSRFPPPVNTFSIDDILSMDSSKETKVISLYSLSY